MRAIVYCIVYFILSNQLAHAKNQEHIVIENDVVLTETLTVLHGETYEYLGNLSTNDCTIWLCHGGTLIIHGDLDIYTGMTVIEGNLIVLGNITCHALSGFNACYFEKESNVVVCGDLFKSTFDDCFEGKLYTNNNSIEIDFPNASNPLLSNFNELKNDDIALYEQVMSLIDGINDKCIWTGEVSNEWINNKNWKRKKLPDHTSLIEIPEISFGNYYPYIQNSTELKSITVLNNAELNLSNGCKLSIEKLNLKGRLFIENTNKKCVSLIVNHLISTLNVTTYKTKYQNLRYWYIGHAITDFDLSGYTNLRSVYNNDYWFRYYRNQYLKINDDTKISPLFGCQLIVRDEMINQDIEITGFLNNKQRYTKILYDGWQLIANPYPAYYNLNNDEVSADFEKTTGTIWIRTQDNNANIYFATHNCATGINMPLNEFDGIVPPGQSFWVKKQSKGKVKMNKQNVCHNNTSLKSQNQNQLIQIIIEDSKGKKDETIINFHERGSTKLSRLDSEKMIVDEISPLIFTKKGSQKLILNTIKILEKDTIIPIFIKTKNQVNSKLHFNYIEKINCLKKMYLLDGQLNKTIDLTTNSTYSYQSTSHDKERFRLKLVSHDITTDIDENLDKIKIKTVKNQLVIKMPNDKPFHIEVYDLVGSKIYQESDCKNNLLINLLFCKPGIYIVNIYQNQCKYTKKVLIE